MFDGIYHLLFVTTCIDDRARLSRTAKVIESSVTDRRMKVFLEAVSADTMERECDWISYVAMSLTYVPPTYWKDEQRKIFENSLKAMPSEFKRLAGIHFAKVSNSFINLSCYVAMTHADGSKHHNVVSPNAKQKEKIHGIADMEVREMMKQGLATNDVGALIAVLSFKAETS